MNMEMKDIKRIEVVCGPGWVAYDFGDGVLKVWTGEHEEDAPPSANRAQILEGYTTWTIEDYTRHEVHGK
jgi:hypothetical protein